MGFLIAFPVLLLTLMVQLAIVSNLPMLGGTADLVMVVLIAWAIQERTKSTWFWALLAGVMVSLISATPAMAPLIGYSLIVFLVWLLKRRVWRIPILVLFMCTVLGTITQHFIYLVVLFFNGNALPVQESLSWVTLPSILLNLLLALPVYGVVTDLAKWIYPIEATA